MSFRKIEKETWRTPTQGSCDGLSTDQKGNMWFELFMGGEVVLCNLSFFDCLLAGEGVLRSSIANWDLDWEVSTWLNPPSLSIPFCTSASLPCSSPAK